MIIDFHTHVFPDAIAQKASGNIAKFYDMPTAYDGTLSTLLKVGGQSGLGGYVVHSVATRPSQVAAINDFIAGICRENSNVWGSPPCIPISGTWPMKSTGPLGWG